MSAERLLVDGQKLYTDYVDKLRSSHDLKLGEQPKSCLILFIP